MYSDPKLSIKHDIKIIHVDGFGTLQVFKNIYHIFFDKNSFFKHSTYYEILVIDYTVISIQMSCTLQ